MAEREALREEDARYALNLVHFIEYILFPGTWLPQKSTCDLPIAQNGEDFSGSRIWTPGSR